MFASTFPDSRQDPLQEDGREADVAESGLFQLAATPKSGHPQSPKVWRNQKVSGRNNYFLGFSKGLKPHFTIFELLTSQYTA